MILEKDVNGYYADDTRRAVDITQHPQRHACEAMLASNKAAKQPIGRTLLEKMYCSFEAGADTAVFCYCGAVVPGGSPVDWKRGSTTARMQYEDLERDSEVISCSFRECSRRFFHKRCVEILGVEKVSRWYCTECEQKMRVVVDRMLSK